ncbi:MAG: hypothetical protein AB2551_00245 [Candidatus Thiodiazotropha sp.]
MICKGCGENKKLIKAHAIPESFFVGLRDGDKAPLLTTDKDGHYPKKTPIGVYDSEILCRECEDRFQEVDDYAQRLLIKEVDTHEEIISESVLLGYIVKNINYSLLKRFFVSVLWRASISTHEFYSRINLGPFEEDIRQIIWSGEERGKGYYDCILAKFVDTELGRVMLDPHMERWDQVNYARFYMYGYVVYIKVDRRPTPRQLIPFVIRDNSDLYIVRRNLLKSKEYPLMLKIAQKLQK